MLLAQGGRSNEWRGSRTPTAPEARGGGGTNAVYRRTAISIGQQSMTTRPIRRPAPAADDKRYIGPALAGTLASAGRRLLLGHRCRPRACESGPPCP